MKDDVIFGIGILIITISGCILLTLAGCEDGRLQMQKEMQNEAVRHGAAEFYVDENNQLQFRWLTKPEQPPTPNAAEPQE